MEYQYARKKDSEAGLPANMVGNMGAHVSMSGKVEAKDENSKDYNNPFEMMPMAGMLFRQTSQAFIGAANANTNSGRISSTIVTSTSKCKKNPTFQIPTKRLMTTKLISETPLIF